MKTPSFDVRFELEGWMLVWADVELTGAGEEMLPRLLDDVARRVRARYERSALTDDPTVTALFDEFLEELQLQADAIAATIPQELPLGGSYVGRATCGSSCEAYCVVFEQVCPSLFTDQHTGLNACAQIYSFHFQHRVCPAEVFERQQRRVFRSCKRALNRIFRQNEIECTVFDLREN